MPRLARLALLALLFSVSAHAAKYEPPAEGSKNPPPSEPLGNFTRFEHRPVALAPRIAKRGDAQTARDHLQANMDLRSVERMKLWNERAADAPARTLIIEPIMEHARFVTPGKRVFVGVLWGSSYVELTLRLTDADTGQVVGEPRFYQRAGAGAAGWGFGAVDRAMLIRLTNMVDAYLRDNATTTIETSVDVMAGDTPEQAAEKQELERRAQAAATP